MESLRKLGLSKYQTEIYLSLLKNGKSSAREIAEKTNVPPTAVYPNLKSLISKQLLQKIEGEFSLFEPLPINAAIQNLILKKQSELEEIKTSAIKTATFFSQQKEKTEKEIVILSRGKTFSSEVYFEAIKKVREKFYIVGWRFEKVGNRYNLLKEFKKIIKRGIDVRIIITGKYEKNIELVKAYKEEGIQLKYSPELENFSILIVDGEECKITLKNRELQEKYNLRILDKSLSKALENYFIDLWKKSEEIRPFP